MQRNSHAVLFMLCSTFSFSFVGLFTKYLTNHIDTGLLTFLRFLIPTTILFLFVFKLRVNRPSRELLKPLWIRALCIGLSQIFFTYSMKHLTLVEGIVLFGTGPLFMPVLEKIFFSVKLQWVTIFGLLLTFSGLLLLAGDVSGITLRPELLIGLTGGILNAGSQLCLYRASKGSLNAFEINFWTFLMAAVVVFPLMAVNVYQSDMAWHPVNAENWLVILVLCLLSMVVINAQVLRSKAFRLAATGSQLTPIMFTSLMFTSIWQLLFYDVEFTFYQLSGLGLIIFANVMNVLLPRFLATLRLKTA